RIGEGSAVLRRARQRSARRTRSTARNLTRRAAGRKPAGDESFATTMYPRAYAPRLPPINYYARFSTIAADLVPSDRLWRDHDGGGVSRLCRAENLRLHAESHRS